MPSGTRPGGRLWPWALTSAALLVLVLFMVGRNIGVGTTRAQSPAEGPFDASTAADPKAAADAPFADGPAAGTPGDAVRAPDISALSPEERADRLFDRVMRLAEQGKRDSVEFFSPMVMSAYQMLGSLNADQHYDLGRIGEVTGVPDLARAEADTILRAHPTHLLGLSLAARVARAAKQDAAARDYYRRLAAAAPTELRKSLPEYTRHRRDIDAALAAATELGISRP